MVLFADEVKNIFSARDIEDLHMAVMNAELDTSGEIRVHLDDTCEGDPMQRTKEIFSKLEMEQTALRNGVLFYIAVSPRKFAILSDFGINAVVPLDFWDEIQQNLRNNIRENNFIDGLFDAIIQTGIQLKKHFPRLVTDVNELPDDIYFGRI